MTTRAPAVLTNKARNIKIVQPKEQRKRGKNLLRGKVVGMRRRTRSEKGVLKKYYRIRKRRGSHLLFTLSGLKKRKRIGRIVLRDKKYLEKGEYLVQLLLQSQSDLGKCSDLKTTRQKEK